MKCGYRSLSFSLSVIKTHIYISRLSALPIFEDVHHHLDGARQADSVKVSARQRRTRSSCSDTGLSETRWRSWLINVLAHLSQWLHLNGFAPVCFLKCLVSSSLRAKRHSQPSHEHLYGFSPAGGQKQGRWYIEMKPNRNALLFFFFCLTGRLSAVVI